MQPMTVGVDVLLEQQERREELGRALEHLTELDRLIVYLRYFQFAGIREIAARTGLTKHAVEARLWRARKVLRRVLEEPTNHTLGQRRRRAMRPPPSTKQESEEVLSMIANLHWP
jgi:DNA-directed RNA polymerase specialized sigma24 family protein